MSNYAWILIIWWKRILFICFIKWYWIKNILSIVIQNKKYLVEFNKHKISSYLVCLFFSFFRQYWILRYNYKYFFQHVLKFSFYNLHFLKALRTQWCVSHFLKRYFFINNIQNFYEEKDWNYSSLYTSLISPDRQFNNVATYIYIEHVLSSQINDCSYIFLFFIFKERKVLPVLFNGIIFLLFIVLVLQYDYVFCIILL